MAATKDQAPDIPDSTRTRVLAGLYFGAWLILGTFLIWILLPVAIDFMGGNPQSMGFPRPPSPLWLIAGVLALELAKFGLRRSIRRDRTQGENLHFH